MNIGLYSGVAAMDSAKQRLDAVAGNLANLNTPGYKGERTSTHAFALEGSDGTSHEIATRATRNWSQGPLKESWSPLHLALEGPGFFTVEGPVGQLYTRSGTFHTNGEGIILSEEGYPAAWVGRQARIDPFGEPVAISGSGVVSQGGSELGRLKITDFARPDDLKQKGGGYYREQPGMRALPAEGVVHQRMLERSNVTGIEELVSMIRIQRGFEAANQLMQLISQSYQRLNQSR